MIRQTEPSGDAWASSSGRRPLDFFRLCLRVAIVARGCPVGGPESEPLLVAGVVGHTRRVFPDASRERGPAHAPLRRPRVGQGAMPGKTSLSSWLSLLDARQEGPDGNAGRFYMDGWRLVLRAQAW